MVARPMADRTLSETLLWADALGMPAALDATIRARDGFDDVVAVLSAAPTGRIVATGNGAAYHAAMALWSASLSGAPGGIELVALPAGLLASGVLAWRPTERLLVISSSGEQRDVLEALTLGAPLPFAAITADTRSTVGRAAAARALVHVADQRAVTHTQAFCGNVAAALSILSLLRRDEGLREILAALPGALERALAEAPAWLATLGTSHERATAAMAFGSGHAWAVALQAALLLKEVAGIPTEGMELREGATSGMYALTPEHLVLDVSAPGDRAADEADAVCAGRGARVLRVPGAGLADSRVASVTTLPAVLALAIELGLSAGHDVDTPPWTDAYYLTAREGDSS